MSFRSEITWDCIGFVLFLLALCGVFVAAVWCHSNGHWEETGNTIPAQDTFMWTKIGDSMVPIPIHTPARPETKWVWDSKDK